MSTNTLTVSTDMGTTQISRHIYGHFSEHLGRCIYDGYWRNNTIRTDIVDALKAVNIPNLRWPGGCFADEYHWRDGIGPRESRPTMINTHWGGVTENNHFGTHEFLELCGLLGCEPYISANVGSGTVQEMAEWVEYLTFNGTSPRADERRANGKEEPWKVKYWGVGNENWGCGGNMRPEYYADEYRRYATYCRNYGGNTLYKIACGPNDGNYKWMETLLKNIPLHMMDGISLHYYTLCPNETGKVEWHKKGQSTGFGETQWQDTMKSALVMDELLTRHIALMDHYEPAGRIGLIVDEWGTWFDVEPGTNPGFLYQQNTMRDALVAGITLNIFHSHAKRVHMANLAQTVNVLQAMILTEGDKMLLTPTYHVFDLYKVHQDATLLPINITTEQYGAVPALHASASKNAEGVVHISVCNLHATESQTLTVDLRGGSFSSVTGRIVVSNHFGDYNTFDAPETVKVTDFTGCKLSGNTLTLTLPAASVVTVGVS
jgi:alpha-L-arabinofuranosidase